MAYLCRCLDVSSFYLELLKSLVSLTFHIYLDFKDISIINVCIIIYFGVEDVSNLHLVCWGGEEVRNPHFAWVGVKVLVALTLCISDSAFVIKLHPVMWLYPSIIIRTLFSQFLSFLAQIINFCCRLSVNIFLDLLISNTA